MPFGVRRLGVGDGQPHRRIAEDGVIAGVVVLLAIRRIVGSFANHLLRCE
jgi:hypothetical protein